MVNWGKLIFGGVDSSDYGIYITGEAVYNAPEREVEFIDIPGRNGSLAMDKGRYNNITVTYPAGTFGKNQEDFREALSAFRNAILSQKGYQRLEDTYHPEEYRMGVYAAGLEVSPASRGKAGQFDLSFVCKPQRFLSIGDYPIPVDSGDILQNPTVFDSSPLLEVEGYGNISFNGYEIDLANAVVGNVELLTRKFADENVSYSNTYHFDRELLNTGDTITVGRIAWNIWHMGEGYELIGETYAVGSGASLSLTNVRYPPYSVSGQRGGDLWIEFNTEPFTFNALAESDSPITKTATITLTGTTAGGSTITTTTTIQVICGYDYITVSYTATYPSNLVYRDFIYNTSPVTAVSTRNILGHPTYIDCEIGEAYRIEDGVIKSLNSYVDLGSDLPTLAPGSNKITFDNTITDFKIAPRWWRV